MADMRAGGTVFELPEFKPYHNRFLSRLMTFSRYRKYYAGTIYSDTQFKLAHKLYAETRSLFAFLARAVELDEALVPGVNGPWELAESTPQGIIDAQQTLYDWSKWDIVADEWIEDGATLGEAMLKIVPQPDLRTVQMQRLKPELCLLIDKHVTEIGVMPLALIVDRSATDAAGKQYEYAEAITPVEIRTYWNGEPHGYDENPDRYSNPLAFVPVLRTKNDADCRPTFAKTLPQIDSVNELASYLNDVIGRHAEPQWAVAGAEQGELQKSGHNTWFLPSGASVDAILAEIDIEGTLKFVQEIKMETKANLPELAFDDLRAKDQIATETLKVQLIELVAKIWKMRRRYDRGLIDAHRMAANAAGVYGVRELAPLLAAHKFDWARPVLPQTRLDEIRLEEAELALDLQKQLATGEGITQMTAGVASELVRGD